jgi:hypothetical protein
VRGVPRRVLLVAAGVVIVIGVVAALLVFPTRYRCNGDDLTFTTSKAFAEQACATGVTGDVVADQRLGPRAGVIAAALLWATVLLRIASDEGVDRRGDEAEP